MSTITISLPDEVLDRLRREAADQGTTPEAVAAARLTAPPPGYGRLARLAGTLTSDLTDASVRADEYAADPRPGTS